MIREEEQNVEKQSEAMAEEEQHVATEPQQ
jgi:hypothetical protein